MIEVSNDGASNRWVATDGAREVGRAFTMIRPDGRCYLLLGGCEPAAYRPLVQAAAAAAPGELYVQVDVGDEAEQSRLVDAGFAVHRNEIHYQIPTDPVGRTLRDIGPPAGFELISAQDADLERLRTLDEALRDDIPGSAGWRWSHEGFVDETFSEGFDPQTYLVAVRSDTGEYAGLIRVWVRREGPRFGMLGVLRPYRRTRLSVALGAAAFRVLRERGYAQVWADVDPTNRASTLLVRRLGAREVGGAVELVRPV
jgi:GNAT superfamily N-acetyltransferase